MGHAGAIVVVSLALVSLAALVVWGFTRAFKRSDDPVGLAVRWVVTAGLVVGCWFTIRPLREGLGQIAGVLAGAVYGLALAVVWGRTIAEAVSRPLTGLYTGGDVAPEPQPLYSIAEAKRIQGHYREALAEVHKQLERFPNDFTGQMMLARIQAEHLHDLDAARLIIERSCQQEGRLPGQIAGAWSTLADWYLKHALDSDAAREALERIITLLPDTPEADMAAQRIARLASTKELVDAYDRPAVHLAEGVKDLGLRQNSAHLRQTERPPGAQAEELVRHLEQHPLDAEAREQLALLYADHYQRLDLAVDQLEQLIQHPQRSLKQVAHWLNLIADLQVRLGNNLEAARQALQRIVDLSPDSAIAENARSRLDHLKLEFKKTEKSQTLQLGTYDKDLGLKRR